MPRKSEAALSIPASLTAITLERPRPPAELSDFEARLWSEIVATKPADWWRKDTFPLLVSYCQAIAQASVIDDHLRAFKPEWMAQEEGLKRYERLIRLRDTLSKQQNMLARAMRLTQQAQWQPVTAARKNAKAAEMPWQSG